MRRGVGESYANGLRKSLQRRARNSGRRGSLQLKRRLGPRARRRRSARLSWLRRRRSPSVSGVFWLNRSCSFVVVLGCKTPKLRKVTVTNSYLRKVIYSRTIPDLFTLLTSFRALPRRRPRSGGYPAPGTTRRVPGQPLGHRAVRLEPRPPANKA